MARFSNLRLRLGQVVSSFFPLFCAHIPATLFYPWRYGQHDAKEISRKSITGSKIKVNTSDEMGYFFSLLGYYDWKIWAIAKAVCKKGDTIIEVGANIGTETIGFSDIVGDTGQVYSFEPTPKNITRLSENIKSQKNVTVFPIAVSDEIGSIDFVLPDDSNSGVGHINYGDQPQSGSSVTVKTTTLDKHLEGKTARLLMMDVEGAEPMVLHGGETWINKNRPVIIVEAHQNRKEMYEFFENLGYSVHSIERLGLREPQTDPTVPQFNWLAIHKSEPKLAAKADMAIKKSGLLPSIKFIQPLAN